MITHDRILSWIFWLRCRLWQFISVLDHYSLLKECPTNKTVLENILKHLVQLKQDNKFLRNEMRKLRENVEMKLQVDENPQVAAAIGGIVSEDFPNLPLFSLGELEKLENLITRDSAEATALARFLYRGSGFNNSSSLTLLIMKRLLGRNIAVQYSLEGRQGKLKFRDLNLFHVVIASVKMKFEDVDSMVISSRIGKVLAGSQDWDGIRVRKRRKCNINEENYKEM